MFPLQKTGEVKAVSASDPRHTALGIGFEKLDRGLFDPSKAYDKMAALGIRYVRIQSGWARTEKQKGVYDFAWLDDIVDNLVSRGMEPWMNLCYGNALYTPEAAQYFGAVGCPPIKDECQRKAWHDFVFALVKHFSGRVKWYEIWNEADGKWCWKHGPSGTEYGEFAKATADAIREADPQALVAGGAFCRSDIFWLSDMFETGCAKKFDALSYHAYLLDDTVSAGSRLRSIKGFINTYNPGMKLLQGETGTQSNPNGCGALNHLLWNQDKQAKYMARHLLAHMAHEVVINSYFSCVDMAEALNAYSDDLAGRKDFGYFGVLGADFDENGIATGEYSPKKSYRTLQVLAAIFRGEFKPVELPLFQRYNFSSYLMRDEDRAAEIYSQGYRRPDGSAAFVYWKPTEILTTSYEATISLDVCAKKEDIRLVDLLDGSIYSIPDDLIEVNGKNTLLLKNIPLRDYPLMVTFGNFIQ